LEEEGRPKSPTPTPTPNAENESERERDRSVSEMSEQADGTLERRSRTTYSFKIFGFVPAEKCFQFFMNQNLYEKNLRSVEDLSEAVDNQWLWEDKKERPPSDSFVAVVMTPTRSIRESMTGDSTHTSRSSKQARLELPISTLLAI
jgi:hypothetical protein